MVSASQISLDGMLGASEKGKRRLMLAATTLRDAGIEYAVGGDHAVAAWVSTADEEAARGAVDVEILVRRVDFKMVKAALEKAGFHHRHLAGLDVFLDTPTTPVRGGVHIIFAKEKVKPEERVANPDVSQSSDAPHFRVLQLEAFVQIKLTAFRDKDRTHLRDLIDVGLVDQTWPARYERELKARLQRLLDTPGG